MSVASRNPAPGRVAAVLDGLSDPAQAARREGLCSVVLGTAIVIYGALGLWLTRGSIPYYDGMAWLLRASDGFEPVALLEPHNGHLYTVTRVIYASGLAIFGPEQVVFQIAQIAAVAASAWLLYMLLRKRMDSLLALVPSLLVLFLGPSTVVIDPNSAAFAQSVAFGLGALLALDRDDRLGDALACLLLGLSLLSISLGLPIAIGAGVLIALRGGRLDRAWVVVVPLLLYGAWIVWAQHHDFGAYALSRKGPAVGPLSNLLLAPRYAADSLAAALGALTGLSGDLAGDSGPGLLDIGWGRVLALAAAAAVAYRAFCGGISTLAIALIAALITYWALGAMNVSGLRLPQTERYTFAVAVLSVLVVAELVPRQLAMSPRIAAAAVALLLFALPGNLYDLRTNGQSIRTSSAQAGADLAMAELVRADIGPEVEISPGLLAPTTAAEWFEFADEHGSIATSLEKLRGEPNPIRQWADVALKRDLGLGPVPLPKEGLRPAGCSRAVAGEGGATEVALPPGGAVLRSTRGGEIGLRRFADDPYEGDPLPANRPIEVAIPADSSTQPWTATIEGGGSVEVCPIGAVSCHDRSSRPAQGIVPLPSRCRPDRQRLCSFTAPASTRSSRSKGSSCWSTARRSRPWPTRCPGSTSTRRSITSRSSGTRNPPKNEIGAVVAGGASGRVDSSEITLFDSTGLAIQDLGIALAAMDPWRGRGQEIAL